MGELKWRGWIELVRLVVNPDTGGIFAGIPAHPTGCATRCSSSVNELESILLFLSCFHKAEVVLSLDQKKARAFNGDVQPLQSNVHLVAHRVGKNHPCSFHYYAIIILLEDEIALLGETIAIFLTTRYTKRTSEPFTQTP